MKNLEIAKIFYEMADILEMQDVQWKPRAYRKAARALESLSEDVEDIYKKKGLKGLEKIPGIGERLAKKIVQYIETGKINEYERLKKTLPSGLTEMMEVMGLGPKKVKVLYKKLKIKNIKELEKAIKEHKLRNLFGFGEKTEKNILESLQLYKQRSKRMLIGFVLPLVNNIVNELKKLKEVHNIVPVGSFRRCKETVGDIDILVTSSNPNKVMDTFVKLPEIKKVLAKGTTKSMVILSNGLQADLRVVEDKSFGSALQYFTGNKDHNIELRKIAIKKGYKLSEYGLFEKRTNKMVAGKTEEEVYKKLGLRYIPPELRENRGEIEAAKRGKLPNLVEYRDIKGDLHIHSKYSDGTATIKEIADAARKIGYKYICITDHSKSRAIAHGLKEDTLLKQIKEIKKLNRKLKGFRIFTGCEVDILPDGSLDYENKILKKLEIVQASVHIKFKMSEKEMTNRLIKALENKYVKILCHPTGRIINERPPYPVDMEELISVAKEKNKILEVNSQPDRLDLSDVHIKKAIENGVKLSIATDAHSLEDLKFMKLGVMQARRGWAEKKDIINCLPLNKLKKILKIGD